MAGFALATWHAKVYLHAYIYIHKPLILAVTARSGGVASQREVGSTHRHIVIARLSDIFTWSDARAFS